MTRQNANFKIIAELINTANKYPDLRFGQMLINLGLVPDNCELWSLESTQMLKRIIKLD